MPCVTGDFDDRVGKGLRGFLRQIVPDAAFDSPVRAIRTDLFRHLLRLHMVSTTRNCALPLIMRA